MWGLQKVAEKKMGATVPTPAVNHSAVILAYHEVMELLGDQKSHEPIC